MSNISIIGSGAWGTAIAKHCQVNGHNVDLVVRDKSQADSINQDKQNKKYLSGINLDGINATTDINENSDVVFITTPSQYMRNIIKDINLNKSVHIVLCCKGIEIDTNQTMYEVASEYFPDNNIMVFSGPTFAIEVASGLPTVATLAGNNTTDIKSILSSPNLRIYETTDITGVEVLGTIKNVLAIACGVVAGKNLGDNAKAGLITRGVAESTRLLIAMGGNEITALSPAGIGDLILTASSMQSRNMSFGFELGAGKSADEILKSRNTVAEGVANTKSICHIAKKHNIEMPICNAVYNIIYNGADINSEIKNLLSRDN